MSRYIETEPCEFCGSSVIFGYSLCDKCDETAFKFDENTGFYILKDGTIQKGSRL